MSIPAILTPPRLYPPPRLMRQRGVLHRDLKPANILLTKSGAIRVADLGISTYLDPSRPLTQNAAGTMPFMAPEVRKYLLGSKVSYSGIKIHPFVGHSSLGWVTVIRGLVT